MKKLLAICAASGLLVGAVGCTGSTTTGGGGPKGGPSTGHAETKKIEAGTFTTHRVETGKVTTQKTTVEITETKKTADTHKKEDHTGKDTKK